MGLTCGPPHPHNEGLAVSLRCYPGCLASRNASFPPVVFGRLRRGQRAPSSQEAAGLVPWALLQGQTVATLSVFFPVLFIQDPVQGKAISYQKGHMQEKSVNEFIPLTSDQNAQDSIAGHFLPGLSYFRPLPLSPTTYVSPSPLLAPPQAFPLSSLNSA